MVFLSVLFSFLFLVMVVSGILALVEIVSVVRMVPKHYKTGISVVHGVFRSGKIRNLQVNQIEEISGLRFRRLDQEYGIFRSSLGFTKLPTPFLVKGVFEFTEDGRVSIQGRLPLFSVLFLGAWLVQLVVFLVTMGFGPFSFARFGVLSVVFFVLAVAILWTVEIGRMRRSVRHIAGSEADPEPAPESVPGEAS